MVKAVASNYREWTSSEVSFICQYLALKTAFQKVASIDTEKVEAVMADGMEYETLNGAGRMSSRPDLGNSKTVDPVCTFFMKKSLLR